MLRTFLPSLLVVAGFLPCLLHGADVVHVYVALCDNASQGIVPVPAKIGDGDKPDDNLYWGCSEGVRSWFNASKHWKKVASQSTPASTILERVVYKHAHTDTYLVADAWRGREIRRCLQTFVKAAAGEGTENIKVGETSLAAGGSSQFVAYIGHNGLMEFTVDWPQGASVADSSQAAKVLKPSIVLCCISGRYFSDKLKAAGSLPVLTTTQLMYPGAFVLHDALEVWLADPSTALPNPAIKAAAARAYSRNQGISVKAAAGVFSQE